MAKFLYLGLSLEQVIERVTIRPASALNFPERLGILKPGEIADVSVFEVVRGKVELRDTTGATRVGSQRLVPVATVKSGHLVRT